MDAAETDSRNPLTFLGVVAVLLRHLLVVFRMSDLRLVSMSYFY